MHAKQALNLLIIDIVVSVILSFLWFLGYISWLVSLFFLVLWILGLINAINAQEKEIPIIGGSELITPTQAKVMILGFPASSTQVTKTTGVGKSKVVGERLFRPILFSFLAALTVIGKGLPPLSPLESLWENHP